MSASNFSSYLIVEVCHESNVAKRGTIDKRPVLAFFLAAGFVQHVMNSTLMGNQIQMDYHVTTPKY